MWPSPLSSQARLEAARAGLARDGSVAAAARPHVQVHSPPVQSCDGLIIVLNAAAAAGARPHVQHARDRVLTVAVVCSVWQCADRLPSDVWCLLWCLVVQCLAVC